VIEEPALPTNPTVPADKPKSLSESWSFRIKAYDNSYRIRWPSYFTDTLGIRAGSWTMVNGRRAEYRGQDLDNESNRPSYQLSQRPPLEGRIRCILHAADGRAVGWFETDLADGDGKLP